mmetsp:Transcript_22544/g.21711  ORF Transcript_22544/g.21711 Transcript_22544/m.21711 type:complete len:93 (-) Transcript_22544:72-350(-)
MEKFKEYCRNILAEKKQKKGGDYVSQIIEQDDQLDLISAYKSLKQAVAKPTTFHAGNTSMGNKNYLKMTIAAQQHSKSKMAKDLLEYSIANR